MPKVIAIIPSAGLAKRMESKQNKAFIKVDGESIIKRTIKTFLLIKEIDQICVMVNPQEQATMVKEISTLANPFGIKVSIVPGGDTRQDSVRLGLEYVVDNDPDLLDSIKTMFMHRIKNRENGMWRHIDLNNLYEQIKSLCLSGKERNLCIVHDGARCLINKELVQDYLKELRQDYIGLGVAVPVKDTIRQIDDAGNVVETPKRSNLRAMQTPQGSDFEVIFAAYQYAKENRIEVTDDLAVLEIINYPVKLYPGNFTNIKITYPQDIPLAEKLLKIE
ncbi:MAG TPA: 2-C-methyl-D-erythritol 4-phosphate cytidylyltransferase [Clostridiaceae bacterium]|mgnify:CR=1 FL=1|nr:2-C-methyl-D-erythritol 4-phosphate cytidylyltransferase [Clostridiaceae bacterium]